MATPLLKVGILVAKQVTKLLAKQLKPVAERPGRFHDMCLAYGQFHNRIEKTVSLKMMGHSVKRVKPLPEAEAVLLGYTVASEVGLVVMFSLLIGLEYGRKNYVDNLKKEELKELRDIEEQALDQRFVELETEIKRIGQELSLYQHMKTENAEKGH